MEFKVLLVGFLIMLQRVHCQDLICLPIFNGKGGISNSGNIMYPGICGCWKVIQRRYNGQVVFHTKNWNQYKNGFGNLSTEFWIGLDKIYHLTRNGGCRLRVELGAFDGSEAYAEYREFSIGSELDLFRLHISGYSGTAGDSIMNSYINNNNMAFTTIDRDNDRLSMGNCAAVEGGGLGAWWWNSCGFAKLNGRWGEGLDTYFSFTWWEWKRADITLKSSTMMIRCD